ncbi:MAG: peptide MFS transporter [Candidatus Sulfomarinibacteraceae bacterium]
MERTHPSGIWNLFVIEMWERFGFYIMSAVYVLYMEKDLHFDDAKKGVLYGLFLFASYTFPLLGGWLGDKILGQLRTIRLGASMMALGYVAMALSSLDRIGLFYTGLALIASGTGIFKVNMSVLVGNLYRNKPELKDAGFNIYYMGVNLGATIGPAVATVFGVLFEDYHISFWAAAIGMVLALLIMQAGQKNLRKVDTSQSVELREQNDGEFIETREFWQRIATLCALFLIAALFWIPFYQNGLGLTLFADRSTVAFRFLRPETYLIFGALFILILTPPLLALFAWLRRFDREPSTPVKIFIGLLIMSFAMFIMVVASWLGGNSDTPVMSPMWLITCYLFITLAEILISPMGQSYVSKVAPPRIQGLMMGGWFASTALGSLSSGIFGSFYSEMTHDQYFMLLSGLSVFAALLVLLFMKNLKRFGN